MLTGDNGMLNSTGHAKEKTERTQVLEIAKLSYLGELIDRRGNSISDETALSAALVELQNNGYEVETVTNAGSIYDGVEVLEVVDTTDTACTRDTIILQQTGSTTIKVNLKMTEGTSKAYVKISGLVCRTSDENKKKNFTEDEATGYEIGVYDMDKNILYYYWTSY